MDPRLVPPLDPASPWSGWALPDLKHCEANLDGWVAAPANTWSNLGYILVGLWLWKKAREEGEPAARAMGAIAVFTGLGSLLYHLSYTYFFQIFDYAGMFLYIVWPLAFGLRRLGLVAPRQQSRVYWAGVGASMAAFFLFRGLGWQVQIVFGLLVALVAAVEAYLYLARREAVDYRPLGATIALFVVGQLFWHLDHADFFCRPDDHLIQGHALWHLVVAFCFVTTASFYKQFTTAEKTT